MHGRVERALERGLGKRRDRGHGQSRSSHEPIAFRLERRHQAEERVYVERHLVDALTTLVPDVTVLNRKASTSRSTDPSPTVGPVLLTLPIPERERETWLTVRFRESLEVVTVIEALSPGNKRAGSDGRKEYLEKRAAVLQSPQHLVELDLLRAGERLPTVEPLPPGGYYAFVCRAWQRPRAEVYARTLRQPMPSILVPIAEADPDVRLDLQAVFNHHYHQCSLPRQHIRST